MSERSCLSVILAAGEGTRMKSSMAKVLHPVGGLAMIGHVAKAVSAAGIGNIALVVGRGGEAARQAVEPFAPHLEVYEQTERRGTAHAVLAARHALAHGYDDVIVVFGDTPLVRPEALVEARRWLAGATDVVVLGFRPPDPAGYGRLIEEDGALVAIREEKDADEREKAVTFCNSGLMAMSGRSALEMLEAIGNANAQGEYYLTDIVEVARAKNRSVVAIEVAAESVVGINTREELARAEALWQARRRKELMLAGVTMIAPETVFLSHDTEIAPDVVIEPNVWFGPGVRVESGAVIHAFSHIEGAHIGEGASVGPFARLRPGADLSAGSKVGNFCEVKRAEIGEGAKVNHLTYIGDATIGAGANIGAGTITCNYDGYGKHLTRIGAGVFIGSNSALVAPVSIGDGAYVASGSVITEDVPEGALAIGRARQVTKDGRAAELRARFAAAKEMTRKNK